MLKDSSRLISRATRKGLGLWRFEPRGRPPIGFQKGTVGMKFTVANGVLIAAFALACLTLLLLIR